MSRSLSHGFCLYLQMPYSFSYHTFLPPYLAPPTIPWSRIELQWWLSSCRHRLWVVSYWSACSWSCCSSLRFHYAAFCHLRLPCNLFHNGCYFWRHPCCQHSALKHQLTTLLSTETFPFCFPAWHSSQLPSVLNSFGTQKQQLMHVLASSIAIILNHSLHPLGSSPSSDCCVSRLTSRYLMLSMPSCGRLGSLFLSFKILNLVISPLS